VTPDVGTFPDGTGDGAAVGAIVGTIVGGVAGEVGEGAVGAIVGIIVGIVVGAAVGVFEGVAMEVPVEVGAAGSVVVGAGAPPRTVSMADELSPLPHAATMCAPRGVPGTMRRRLENAPDVDTRTRVSGPPIQANRTLSDGRNPLP